MIKANKKVSMLLVLAMLMTMFIGIGTASAATFSESPVQTKKGDHKTLGTVNIKLDTWLMESDTYQNDLLGPDSYKGEWLTITLDGAEFQQNDLIGIGTIPAGDQRLAENMEDIFGIPAAVIRDMLVEMTGLQITTSGNIEFIVGKLSAKDTIELFVVPKEDDGDTDANIKLEFKDINVKKSSGDVLAKFTSPSGGEFPLMTVKTIATIGKGSTTVQVKSIKQFGGDGGYIDTIIILENQIGVFEDNEVIKVKLPKGFSWDLTVDEELEDDYDKDFAAGAWGFAGEEFKMSEDGRTLSITVDQTKTPNSAGRVNISSSTGGFVKINVDENTAKFGDVLVDITSSKDAVDVSDLKIAVYGDYGVEVVEGTKEEVKAGFGEQELGEFYIEEKAAGSMVAGRTLYFELPKGVKWEKDYKDGKWEPKLKMEVEDGTGITKPTFEIMKNTSDRKIKVDFMFDTGSFSDEAVKLLISDMEVKIAPSFEGPIEITVTGRAGAEGAVTVAECIKPITIKAENPTKVEIGAMNQKAADILIIENVKEAIAKDGDNNRIEIELPRGVYFSSVPTVAVEEGDLEIDDYDVEDSEHNNDGKLVITIDVESTKASTIRISDVFLTVDRTVPEGSVMAKFVGAKVEEVDLTENNNGNVKTDVLGDEGSTAFVTWATDESIGSLEIANTITPSQGGHAKFVIGSNIYEIGGVPFVMEVVPYIKDSRSFVPLRQLAQMLGAEIQWGKDDQTVTLVKEGETEVVFTIGSTSYNVNGETLTMDVAPEIVNDRSFLPARFAAEAFGAEVGWDEATQTVVIVRKATQN